MDWSKIIEAAATLLWPVIVIILIFMFTPGVAAIIASAKFRKFTFKIGGQEITMEQMNEQQRQLNNDLISRVGNLEHAENLSATANSTTPRVYIATDTLQGLAVLWVDDNPKNNSLYIQQLTDMGLKIDIALSTVDGVRKFSQNRYSLVISDMGRKENDTYKYDAGLELLKGVRSLNTTIPYIIFSTSKVVREYGSKAKTLGVTWITSSPTELFAVLQNELVKCKKP